MSNLREELADQLFRAWHAAVPGSNGWLLVADECIRQMEWARRECVIPFQPDYDECEIDYSAPLTLAPKDWQP